MSSLLSERILPVMLEDEMRASYLAYSMSVIVSNTEVTTAGSPLEYS